MVFVPFNPLESVTVMVNDFAPALLKFEAVAVVPLTVILTVLTLTFDMVA